MKWLEVSKVPGLEKFLVMSEFPDQYGKLEKLEPTKSNLFSHVVFRFLNTEGWRIKPDSLAIAVKLLGGKVVGPREAILQSSNYRLFNISSTTEPGLNVYRYCWVVDMIAFGRIIRRDRYLVEDQQADSQAFSQVSITVMLLVALLKHLLKK